MACLACTYGRRNDQRLASNQTVRVLQYRLRRARQLFNEFQERDPSLKNMDFDRMLSTYEEDGTNQSQASEDHDPEPANDNDGPMKLDSMMSSYGRASNTCHPSAAKFYGASSGFAFLNRTQDYFSRNLTDQARYDQTSDTVAALFDAPLPQDDSFDNESIDSDPSIPKEKALDLIDSVFKHCYPLFKFIEEDYVRTMTIRMYDTEIEQHEGIDHAFLPLFHVIMALAYLFDRAEHGSKGCRHCIITA